MRRQGLRDSLRQYELKTVERCETVRCGRVVEHGTHVAGGEADKHGVVNKAPFVDGASVDNAATQSRDLCFGFSTPLTQLVLIARRPMLQFEADFGLIVKGKPVLELNAVVSS